MGNEKEKFAFAAVANGETRVLILGSLPGEASLAKGQYYAHPRNQFWRLMEAVTDRSLVALPYAERLEALLAAGVGLWDVVRSASRAGSLDSSIRGVTPNSLRALTATLPSLQAIGFNGLKASAIGRKQLAADGALALTTLPSSSIANTASFESKQREWLQLRIFLTEAP